MSELNREEIEKSINYVEDVLENWTMWQTHHNNLTQAMRDILSLVKELTKENERLGNRITCQVVLPDGKLEEIKNECLERVELDVKECRADTARKMQTIISEKYAVSKVHYVKCEEPTITYQLTNWDLRVIAKEMLEGEANATVQ